MLVRPVRRTSSACRVGIVPSKICLKSPGEVFTEELGGAVQPASQNPYPIYDQICDFPYPTYDLKKRKLDSQDHCGWHAIALMAKQLSLGRAFVDGLINKDEKVLYLLLNNIPNYYSSLV